MHHQSGMSRPLYPGHTGFSFKAVASGRSLDSEDQGAMYELGVSLCVRPWRCGFLNKAVLGRDATEFISPLLTAHQQGEIVIFFFLRHLKNRVGVKGRLNDLYRALPGSGSSDAQKCWSPKTWELDTMGPFLTSAAAG